MRIGNDGLPVIPVKVHSYRKTLLLRYYINPLTLILSKRFTRTCYIDGFSGPGRVLFKGTLFELDGSPLIALKAKPGFTDYVFCEKDRRFRNALELRADAHTVNRNVTVWPAQDFNQVAPSIIKRIPIGWHVFAFLDPFGLELNWTTVKTVSSVPHRELIINISAGLFRCASSSHTQDTVDRVMGMHDDWSLYDSKELLALYKTNVGALGFEHVRDYPVRGNRGPIYYLILATNSPTAVKIVGQRMSEVNLTGVTHLQLMVEREAGRLSTLDDFIETPQTKLDAFTAQGESELRPPHLHQ